MMNGTVGEVAKLFGISPSKLRYWDEQGLLRFGRDAGNQYRVPDFFTLLDVCDVLFYRGLSLPVKDIRGIPELDARALLALLETNEAALEQKMEALRASIGRIRSKRRMLERLAALKAAPLEVVQAALPGVDTFTFADADVVRAYVQDPHTAMVLLGAGGGEPEYGILGAGTLRPADAGERTYLHGLFSTSSSDPAVNSGALFWARAKELGAQPGMLVGRYLATVCEGERSDFYEAWMELG